MNLVLDQAAEVSVKKKTRKELGGPCAFFIYAINLHLLLGRILLKGETISLMQALSAGN
jgi:small nuclear ribonucleoprotein (snRNP)-like protein